MAEGDPLASPRPASRGSGLVDRLRHLTQYGKGASALSERQQEALAATSHRGELHELFPVLEGLDGYVLFAGQLAAEERCWVHLESRSSLDLVERPLRVPAEAKFVLVLVDVDYPHSAVEALQELVTDDPVPTVALLLQQPGQPRDTARLVRATSVLSAAMECPILVQPSCNQDLPAMLALTLKSLEVKAECTEADTPSRGARSLSVPDSHRTLPLRIDHRAFSEPASPGSSQDSPKSPSSPGFATSVLYKAQRSSSPSSTISSSASTHEPAPDERSALARKVQQECQFLRHFQHPNLPSVQVAVEAHVARLLRQRPMPNLKHTICSLGRLPQWRAQNIFHEIASGVAHLHDHRIAHRNLKPESVLILPSGICQIVSYSRAVKVRVDRLCVEKCGTMPFTAPEVLAEQRYDAARADVWSMGVTLLEMSCGINALPRMLGWSKGVAPTVERAEQLMAFFEDVPHFLRCMRELGGDELDGAGCGRDELLCGMLQVRVADRWSAAVAKDCRWASQGAAVRGLVAELS